MEKLLTIKEVSELLQVNERTVHRLIQGGRIPATKVGNQWRFHPVYLEEWLLKGGEARENLDDADTSFWQEDEFQVFAQERVRLNLAANSANEAIQRMVQIMVETGHLLQGEMYLQAVLERENVSTTGIGQGVAIPHAWHPINDLFRVPLVACGRFDPPVEFNAVDSHPVDLVFLLCCPRNRHHLTVLRSLSQIAQNKELVQELRRAKTPSEFISPLSHALPVQIG